MTPIADAGINTRALAGLIAPLRALAADAAAAILTVYRTEFAVTEKPDHTPVTAADLAAHAILVEGLARLTPGTPILSEEAAIAVPFEQRRGWQRLWLVDPLDGTREFIRRSDEFSINLALIEDHAPVLGLIALPVSGTVYFAWRGGGAWKCAPGGGPLPIRARALGPGPVRVAGSRHWIGHPLATYLERLGRHEYRGVGSALKACLIAEGRADLYPRFGPTCEWDTAASQILLEEAGGALTDLFLRPLRYNARPTLLNPDFLAFGDRSRDWVRYLPRRKSKA